MTLKATDLLELLNKADTLDYPYFIRATEEGDYIIRFTVDWYDCDDNFHDGTTVVLYIDRNGNTTDNGTYDFQTLNILFNKELEKKEQEKVKEQKRKELIARLTPEEREILGV